jgi:hypothetical protein
LWRALADELWSEGAKLFAETDPKKASQCIVQGLKRRFQKSSGGLARAGTPNHRRTI